MRQSHSIDAVPHLLFRPISLSLSCDSNIFHCLFLIHCADIPYKLSRQTETTTRVYCSPKGTPSNTLSTTPPHYSLHSSPPSIYKNYMLKLLRTLLVGCQHGVLTNFDFAERDHLSTGFGSDSATFRSSLAGLRAAMS